MLDASLVTIILNSGLAGVFLILFLTGFIVPKSHLAEKQKECDEVKIQRDLERQRADVAQQQSLTGLQVMQAIRDAAYDSRRASWQQEPSRAPLPPGAVPGEEALPQ